MKKSILTYLIIFAFNLAFGQNHIGDTIKIILHINNKLIREPFQSITITFKTPRQLQNIKLEKDYILVSSFIPDTSEIIIIYQKEEIGRCYKYAPGTLGGLAGLDIKILTSKKALRKELEASTDSDTQNYGTLKSMCVVSTIPKDGDGVLCKEKKWKGHDPVEYKKSP